MPATQKALAPERRALYVLEAAALEVPSGMLAERALKRAIDIAGSAALLVLTLPLMVLVAILIKVTSRGCVVLRQRRVGRYRVEFMMYKFRTMRADAPRHEARLARLNGDRIFLKIERDTRVTWVGRFLRKYSVDELPQFWNVLRGEMSLVGPRPLLPSDMRRFPPTSWRRFVVPPGLTGLWQVSGRSLCSDAERIRLDIEYVKRWSLLLDLRILIQTPLVVLLGKGAS